MFRTLSDAIFKGDPLWAWRRRIAIVSTTVMLTCYCYGTFWDRDVAHASIVLTNSIAGLTAVLTVFFGMTVTDDHLRRRNDRMGQAPRGDDPDAN